MAEEKEDDWHELRSKWSNMVSRKRVETKKLLLSVAVLILASVSILVAFYYFDYFAFPTYGNVDAAIMGMVGSEGNATASLSGLPAGRCYWIRPTYNESGHFVEVIEYDAESQCLGVVTNKTVLRLESALNIGTRDCVCGDSSYTMEKTLDRHGINLKLTAR